MRIQPGPFSGNAYRQAISGSGRMNRQERAQAETAVLTYLSESASGVPLSAVVTNCSEATYLRSRTFNVVRALIARGVVETFTNQDDAVTPTWVRLPGAVGIVDRPKNRRDLEMSSQENGENSLPEVPLELSGLLIQAQDYANTTGKAVQIMLPDFKYGNARSFEITPQQKPDQEIAATGGA